MPWTKKEKYFASLLLKQNHLKLCKQNFAGSLTLTIIPRKAKFIIWYIHQFQGTGVVNNHNKKLENPRSGRKLTARCPDNVVRYSVRRTLKSL